MPLPKPSKGQNRNQYMDVCMHELKKGKERPQKQRVAICLREWGKSTNEDAILKRFALLIGEIEEPQCPKGQKY